MWWELSQRDRCREHVVDTGCEKSIRHRNPERTKLEATWDFLQPASSYKGRMAPSGLISGSSLLPGPSFPPLTALVASRWGPDSGSHYLWPSLSPPLCQEEQPPREYALPSVWLLQNSILFSQWEYGFGLARIKPHETEKFLELNWAIRFIEKEKRNPQTPWLVQLDKRITFEVRNVK